MSAREMFEKLGFKIKLENRYVITYIKEDIFGDIEISFNKEHKFTSLETLEHNTNVIKSGVGVFMSHYKAIQQQIKELNWEE